MGSRGSVIPYFYSLKDSGLLPITHMDMTRFMISLNEGVELVWTALEDMKGGEIYVKKIPSMGIQDIAKAIAPHAKLEIVGIRPGEKIHEQMIGVEDAAYTYEYPDHFKILPALHDWYQDLGRVGAGKKVPASFTYSSDSNLQKMTIDFLSDWIAENLHLIGKI
jgi:FlaA1/EpsC-like NDP-sugar epimerase